MKNRTTLVVGATGTVGAEVCRLLKQKNIEVRGTTSRVANSNSELVHLNLLNGAGMESAFSGISRLFLLSPPGHVDQHKILSPLIKLAKDQGLEKVVLMTAMGANADANSPFRKLERDLENSGLSYNIIRPNWFMQNFNSFWIQGINDFNKITLPAGQAKVSFIDSRDISSVATSLLTTDNFSNKDFDLTGPEAIDHSEVADIISSVSKRRISYEEISPEEFKSLLLKANMPADYADFLVVIFGFLKQGFSSAINSNVEMITGMKARTIREYANDYKKMWMK